jgi:sulfonate transport system substrate-binding protein
MLRIAGLLLSPVVFFLLLAPAALAGTTIRLGYPGVGIDNRPFGYGNTAALAHVRRAVEEEFKDRTDIQVAWTFFRGAGPALNEAMAAGQLDFAASLGDLPSIVGRSRGLDTEFLLPTEERNPLYLAVAPNSNIRGIDDLKGRKVAQFRGTNRQVAVDQILAAHGLNERSVRFINMDMGSSMAALVSGQVEAVFGGVEYLDLADRGLVKIAYSSKNDNPAFFTNGALFVTRSFERAHPDLTQRVVLAFVKSAYFGSIEANRSAVFAAWAKSGIPVRSFEQDLDHASLATRNTPVIDDYIVARYKALAARAKQYGLITADIAVDGWIQRKYVDQALAQLGLQHYWPMYDANGKTVLGVSAKNRK